MTKSTEANMSNTEFIKPSVFIFDIDGTLADHTGVRNPYDETKVNLDRPIMPVILVLQALRSKFYNIIFLSGRTEFCREETEKWLKDNIFSKFLREKIEIKLFMRQRGDRRKDDIVKKEIYDTYILPFYNVIGVFDDRLQVCRMLYEEGIFCFNVNQGLKEY